MKYYSELTKKIYNTVDELETDEAVIKAKEAAEKERKEKLKEEKSDRASEINKNIEDFFKLAENTSNLINAFEKDYGNYNGIDTDKMRAFLMTRFWWL